MIVSIIKDVMELCLFWAHYELFLTVMFERCRCGDCVVPGGAHEHGCIQLHLSSVVYCHEGSWAGFVWRHQVCGQSTFSCYSNRLPVGSCAGAVRASEEGTAARADQIPLMLCTCVYLKTTCEITGPRLACLHFAGGSTCQTCVFLKFCPVRAFFEFQFWGFSALETMTRYEEMERCKNHKSFVLQTLLFILAFPMLHTSQDAFLGGVLVHVMSQSGVRKDKHGS